MIMAPWLSIVTITKDDPVGLARTVASATGLRRARAEHIIIDGSAKEAGRAHAAAGGADGAQVLERPARGIADAFNFGLAQARAPWVWFLNGGDAVHELLDIEWLNALLAGTSADLVLGGLIYDADGILHLPPPLNEQWPLLRPWIAHPASLIRRPLFSIHGGFDERFEIAMDYEWFLRVLVRGARADLLNIPLARFAPGGLSQRVDQRAKIIREHRVALRLHRRALWKGVFTQAKPLAWQAVPLVLRNWLHQ